jgi:hypothetical protein
MRIIPGNIPGFHSGRISGFSAGFSRFQLIHAGVRERFNSKEHRQFEVLVWYPADAVESKKTKPYLSNHVSRNLSILNWTFGKSMVEDVITKRKTRSYEHVPVSEKRDTYPVLLFSHDLGSLPEYYTQLMESLAREGYFVFSVNHTYLSEEVTLVKSDKSQPILLRKYFMALQWMMQRKMKAISRKKSYEDKWLTSKKIDKLRHLLSGPIMDWCGDKKFLLNYLEGLNHAGMKEPSLPHNFFAGRLDLSHIAVMGHGWGGASSVHSLLFDKRIKAAVNLDGFQFSEGIENAIHKPLLMIYSEEFSGMNEGIYFNTSDYEMTVLENSTHRHFMDWIFYPTQSDSLGFLQNDLTLERLTEYIFPFLEKNLKIPYEASVKKVSRY